MFLTTQIGDRFSNKHKRDSLFSAVLSTNAQSNQTPDYQLKLQNNSSKQNNKQSINQQQSNQQLKQETTNNNNSNSITISKDDERVVAVQYGFCHIIILIDTLLPM